MMAQAVEKVFEQKLLALPHEVWSRIVSLFILLFSLSSQEYEITPGQKGKKPGTARGTPGRKPKAAGDLLTHTML